jgi:hypothetical protein
MGKVSMQLTTQGAGMISICDVPIWTSFGAALL